MVAGIIVLGENNVHFSYLLSIELAGTNIYSILNWMKIFNYGKKIDTY